jgi:hypothetical protein
MSSQITDNQTLNWLPDGGTGGHAVYAHLLIVVSLGLCVQTLVESLHNLPFMYGSCQLCHYSSRSGLRS